MKNPTRTCVLLGLAALGVVLTWGSTPGRSQLAADRFVKLAASDFDESDEGWFVSGDVQPGIFDPLYDRDDTRIAYVSQSFDDLWYWESPDKFNGDLSAAYLGTLIFQIGAEKGEGPRLEPDFP